MGHPKVREHSICCPFNGLMLGSLAKPFSRFTENPRVVEIIGREFEHDPLVHGERGFCLGERLREMGENRFPVRQLHPIKDRVQVFQYSPDGVDRGIWHGVSE